MIRCKAERGVNQRLKRAVVVATAFLFCLQQILPYPAVALANEGRPPEEVLLDYSNVVPADQDQSNQLAGFTFATPNNLTTIESLIQAEGSTLSKTDAPPPAETPAAGTEPSEVLGNDVKNTQEILGFFNQAYEAGKNVAAKVVDRLSESLLLGLAGIGYEVGAALVEKSGIVLFTSFEKTTLRIFEALRPLVDSALALLHFHPFVPNTQLATSRLDREAALPGREEYVASLNSDMTGLDVMASDGVNQRPTDASELLERFNNLQVDASMQEELQKRVMEMQAADQSLLYPFLNANAPPDIYNLPASITVGEGVPISITFNTFDPDIESTSESVTWKKNGVAQASLPGGVKFNPTSRVFSWTPTLTQAGSYDLLFKTVDPNGNSSEQTVTLNILDAQGPVVMLSSGGENGAPVVIRGSYVFNPPKAFINVLSPENNSITSMSAEGFPPEVNVVWTPKNATSGTLTASLPNGGVLYGSFTGNFIATDSQGNTTTVPITFKFEGDYRNDDLVLIGGVVQNQYEKKSYSSLAHLQRFTVSGTVPLIPIAGQYQIGSDTTVIGPGIWYQYFIKQGTANGPVERAISPVLQGTGIYNWDTTAALSDGTKLSDGQYALSVKIYDYVDDPQVPLDRFYLMDSIVNVDNVPGPVTGPQYLVATGLAAQLGGGYPNTNSLATDFLYYSGTPTLNDTYPQPHSDALSVGLRTLEEQAAARLAENWVIETPVPKVDWGSQGTGGFFLYDDGNIGIDSFYTREGVNTEAAVGPVMRHRHYDGGRGQASVDPYSTFLPAEGGAYFVSVNGRVGFMSYDGTVKTLIGLRTRTDVIPYDKSANVTLAQVRAHQEEVVGTFREAEFFMPNDIALDLENQKIYVADTGNHVIQEIDLSKQPPEARVLAGKVGQRGSTDGTLAQARFNRPYSIAIKIGPDGTRRLFVADRGNDSIREINLATGQVGKLASISGPQVIRSTTPGSLVIGSPGTGRIDRVYVDTVYDDAGAVTHTAGEIELIGQSPVTDPASWIWVDADTNGDVESLDADLDGVVTEEERNHPAIFIVNTRGGDARALGANSRSSVRVWRWNPVTRQYEIHDFLPYQPAGLNKGRVQGTSNPFGHYVWAFAIDKGKAGFFTTGIGQLGVSYIRLEVPGDPPLTTAFDKAAYNRGQVIYEQLGGPSRGSLKPLFLKNSLPSLDLKYGSNGHNWYGQDSQTFAGLTAAIFSANGTMDLLKVRELADKLREVYTAVTGFDLVYLIYYILMDSVQGDRYVIDRRETFNALTEYFNPQDNRPPSMNVTVKMLDPTTAEVIVLTDEDAFGAIQYGPTDELDLAFNFPLQQLGTGYAKTHTFIINNLEPGRAYTFSPLARDNTGNWTEWDKDKQVFVYNSYKPVEPVQAGTSLVPIISNVQASGLTSSAATIAWNTDVASDSQIQYGLTAAYGNSSNLNAAMQTSHSLSLSSLTAGTLYHYRVKSRDASGNLAVSTDFTFTTAGTSTDTTAPILTNILVSNLTPSGATITWTTNEGSDTQVEYGLTTSYGSSTTPNAAMVTSHSQALSSLTAITLYHYRVKSRDAAGNLKTSADFTFTTNNPADTKTGALSLDFSIYAGGGGAEQIRGITTDSQGNIYLTGGTKSITGLGTPGAYDTTYNGGPSDVFVEKRDPQGNLLWQTYLGGNLYDKAFDIEVDADGYIWVAGSAGQGFPLSPDAPQKSYQGYQYMSDAANAFIAKFSPDGKKLDFSTYLESDTYLIRDLVKSVNPTTGKPVIYAIADYKPNGKPSPFNPQWFANAHKKTPGGQTRENIIFRIDDQNQITATFVAPGSLTGSIAINPTDGSVGIFTMMPSGNNIDPANLHFAKYNSDLSELLWETKLAGNGLDATETHHLAINENGGWYFTVFTTSTDLPTSPNAFQRTSGGGTDIYVGSLRGEDGTWNGGTYFGGTGDEWAQGVSVGPDGKIYVTGSTFSSIPVTKDAFQKLSAGAEDGVLAVFSVDFQLLYASYYGGLGDDQFRATTLAPNGNLLVAGQTRSSNLYGALNSLNGKSDGLLTVWSSTTTPVNGSPVANPKTVSATEDITVNGSVSGTDGDGDSLAYSKVTDPSHGTLTLNLDGSFSYIPAVNYNGTDSFTFKVNDGTVDSATATVSITVNAVNDAPTVANPIGDVTVNQDTSINLANVFADLDIATNGDSLTLSAVSSNTTLATVSLNGTDLALKLVPGQTGTGTATITVRATDLSGLFIETAFIVTAVTDEAHPLPRITGIQVLDPAYRGNSVRVTYSVDVADGFNNPFFKKGGHAHAIFVTAIVASMLANLAPAALAAVLNNLTIIGESEGRIDMDLFPGWSTTIRVADQEADGFFSSVPVEDIPPGPASLLVFTVTGEEGHPVDLNDISYMLAPVEIPNRVPAANGMTLNVNEDTESGGSITSTDADGDTLTALLVSGSSNGALTFNADGTFTYMPNADFNGSDSFTYRVTDSFGGISNVATVDITVNLVNDAPTANDQTVTLNEDTSIAILLGASDVENNALSYTIVDASPDGTLSGNGNTLTFTPNANFNGSTSFTFKVNDGSLDSNLATVTININPVDETNEPPPVTSYITAEDTPVILTLPAGATIVTPPSNGTLSQNPDGTWTYTSNPNFNGTDSFTYQTINQTNSAARVVQDEFDSALSANWDIRLGNLSSVSDINGSLSVLNSASKKIVAMYNQLFGPNQFSEFTFASVGMNAQAFVGAPQTGLGPRYGLSLSHFTQVNGQLRADTELAFTGTSGIVPRVSFVTVPVDVNVGDTFRIERIINDEGNPVLIGYRNGVEVLRWTDARPEALRGDGLAGAAIGAPNGSWSSFTFPLPVFDRWRGGEINTSDVTTVTVTGTINPINDAPVAGYSALSGSEDTAVSGSVNMSDVDGGDTLTATVVNGPSNGSLTLNADGTFTYTPNANFNGTDSFTYKVNDGSLDSAAATVSLTINAVNDAPVAQDGSLTTDEDTKATGSLKASDIDQDDLIYSLVTNALHGTVTVNSDGSYSYVPDADYNGTDLFTFRVNDGALDSEAATVSITVNAVNDYSGIPAELRNGDFSEGSLYWTCSTCGGRRIENNTQRMDASRKYVRRVDQVFQVTAQGSYEFGGEVLVKNLGGNGVRIELMFFGGETPVNPVNPNKLPQPIAVASTEWIKGTTSGWTKLGTTVTAPEGATQVLFRMFMDKAASGTARFDNLYFRPPVTNHAPTVSDQSAATDEDTPLTGAVSAEDSDGDPLSYSVVSGPSHGALELREDGTYTYTPDPNFNGTDSFTFRAHDGTEYSNEATVSITVNPVDDPPTLTIGGQEPVLDENGNLTAEVPAEQEIEIAATDPDGDLVSVVGFSGIPSGWGAIIVNGRLRFTAWKKDIRKIFHMAINLSDGTTRIVDITIVA